ASSARSHRSSRPRRAAGSRAPSAPSGPCATSCWRGPRPTSSSSPRPSSPSCSARATSLPARRSTSASCARAWRCARATRFPPSPVRRACAPRCSPPMPYTSPTRSLPPPASTSPACWTGWASPARWSRVCGPSPTAPPPCASWRRPPARTRSAAPRSPRSWRRPASPWSGRCPRTWGSPPSTPPVWRRARACPMRPGASLPCSPATLPAVCAAASASSRPRLDLARRTRHLRWPRAIDSSAPCITSQPSICPQTPCSHRTKSERDTMTGTTPKTAETHTFQAEVAQLLHLMVHSVYSEADIFLRELISNASDACDKLRYEAIARPELMADGAPLSIRITPDEKAGTLTVADTGIGMDRQELISDLGTIARSGTRAFMSRLAQAQDGSGLIGQFGVGFYSAFMVADRIEVTSRKAGTGEVWVWRSSGDAGFETAPAPAEAAERLKRGTQVVLHLKPDARRFLEPGQIERVVRAYSDHILFPIELAD